MIFALFSFVSVTVIILMTKCGLASARSGDCPFGFTKDGSLCFCTSVVQFPLIARFTEPVCPEGWTYNGRNCYCDNFVLRRECPSGWHRIGNNCYLLNRGTVNYQTATQTCTAFNSQVVSFDSEDEAIRVNGTFSICLSYRITISPSNGKYQCSVKHNQKTIRSVEYLHDNSVGSDRWSNAEVGAWIHDQITKCFGHRQPDGTRSPGMFIDSAGLNSLGKSLAAEAFGNLPIAGTNYWWFWSAFNYMVHCHSMFDTLSNPKFSVILRSKF